MKYQKVNLKIKDYDDIYNHPLALKCNIDKIFVNYDTYNDIDITFEGKMILEDENIYLHDEIKIYGNYIDIDNEIIEFHGTCNFKSNLLNGEYIYVDLYDDSIRLYYVAYYINNLIKTYECYFTGEELDITLYNNRGKKIQKNFYNILVDEFEMFEKLYNMNKEERLSYIKNILNNLNNDFYLIYFNKIEKINKYYKVENNNIYEIKYVTKEDNDFREYYNMNVKYYIKGEYNNDTNLTVYSRMNNKYVDVGRENNDYDFDINDC